MFDSAHDIDNTRDRLVSTAACLLMRQSFGSVSVDDICKSADVKKGTFYHHFPSKVELVLAAYDCMYAYAKEKLSPCFAKEFTPFERLKNYAGVSYAFHKESFDREGKIYGCPIASAGAEMGAQEDSIRQKINQLMHFKTEFFVGVIQDVEHLAQMDDENKWQLAREMTAYVSGVLVHAKIANDPEIIRRDLYNGLKRLISYREQEAGNRKHA